MQDYLGEYIMGIGYNTQNLIIDAFLFINATCPLAVYSTTSVIWLLNMPEIHSA